MGGLGNQMFQYALGRKVALTTNTTLALDLSFLNKKAEIDTPRNYELGCFNINPILITESISGNNSVLLKIPCFSNKYLERQLPFNSEALKQPDDTLFIGYWQTDKYFIDIRKQLLLDFTLKNNLSADDKRLTDCINMQTSVSLHVRRGDYASNIATNKFHGLMGIDYYKEALSIIGNKVGAFKLFIFSDDITWCKKNLADIHADIVFVNGERDGYVDMHLMKLCNHNIIANSSFSWWAAWLNLNLDKIVIAPNAWVKDVDTDTSDIIPNAWQKI